MTIEVVSNQIVDELGNKKVDFQKGVEIVKIIQKTRKNMIKKNSKISVKMKIP